MKRIIALILVALMVVPFAVLASAAGEKITLPAKPEVTSNNVYYCAATNTADPIPTGYNVVVTSGWDPINYPAYEDMYNAMKSGGTYIACGKLYIGATCTIAATDTTCLFTGVDTANNVDYRSKKSDGSYLVVDDFGANAGQKGMLMIRSTVANPDVATFMGDVIFDNICIVDRSGSGQMVSSTLEVGSTGRMVITNTVDVLKMHDLYTNISVQEGGYLFLNTTGFQSYKGQGVIVLGADIKDEVTADTFKGFKGIVAYEDGTIAYDLRATEDDADDTTVADTTVDSSKDTVADDTTKADTTTKAPTTNKGDDTTKAPTTTKAPSTTKAPQTNDGGAFNPIIFVIIVAVALAVVVVVIIVVIVVIVVAKKKKK